MQNTNATLWISPVSQFVICCEFITVRLISIDHPQIEGKFTETPGGLPNVFYGCKDLFIE
jgi:hypothetical protein